jgi:hypothetical protein
MAAATGDIIAYLDSDAVADPDWLTYLAWKFKRADHVGVGGPNLPPPEEDWLANCVASAPGSPTHILLDDETAEHIPGCNMAFRKEALAEIDGFDTTYTAAGDDVDICWRLQERGHTIGFSPAAIVWHHRRKTIKSYLKQQMGYGKAEAMLLQKHPDRFNAVGCARWAGRIYGGIRTNLSTAKGFIYYGPFGSGLFQRVYHAPHSWLADLPLSLEWNIVTVLLLLGGFLSPLLLIFGGLSGTASVWAVVQQTRLTDVPVKHHRRLGKLLVGALHYIQPLARGWARVKRVWQQQPRATLWTGLLRRFPWGTWKRRAILSYWTEEGIEKDVILQSLIQHLREGGYPTLTDSGWKPWDLAIDEHLWSRIPIEVVVENHGASKRLARFRISWHLAPVAKAILWTCGGFLILGMLEFKPWLAAVTGIVTLAGFSWVMLKSMSAIEEMSKMIRVVAAKLKLLHLNGMHEHA